MSNEEMMRRLLAPYGPQRPLQQLVVEVNRIYHSFEARDYNSIHPEITEQLPPLWREMVGVARKRRTGDVWRILDFGCGTGFEAEQLLRNLPVGSIQRLVCYDPSPEMLTECRKRISPLSPTTEFTTDLGALRDQVSEQFNLLATNSLLHHLPEPLSILRDLAPVLSDDASWLAGHEPSARYYRNPECRRTHEEFLRRQNRAKYLSPARYRQRLELLLGWRPDPVGRTAREAYTNGLFTQVPPRTAIGRLVDYHVAHSPEEANQGRGLDIEKMKQELAREWQVIWVRSYAFMGPFYEGKLPARWARAASRLAAKYPMDGANFSCVWVREK